MGPRNLGELLLDTWHGFWSWTRRHVDNDLAKGDESHLRHIGNWWLRWLGRTAVIIASYSVGWWILSNIIVALLHLLLSLGIFLFLVANIFTLGKGGGKAVAKMNSGIVSFIISWVIIHPFAWWWGISLEEPKKKKGDKKEKDHEAEEEDEEDEDDD